MRHPVKARVSYPTDRYLVVAVALLLLAIAASCRRVQEDPEPALQQAARSPARSTPAEILIQNEEGAYESIVPRALRVLAFAPARVEATAAASTATFLVRDWGTPQVARVVERSRSAEVYEAIVRERLT